MAKKLVIAFDFFDEEGNSLSSDHFNDMVIPLAVDEITVMDVIHMWMFIKSLTGNLLKCPLVRHLFPQTPYGISMEPGSKVTDKSDRIFFEYLSGHTRLVYPLKDGLHDGR